MRRFPTGSGRSSRTCSASANAKPNCCSAASALPLRCYGDPEAQERLIPFDVIPRILSAAEWENAAPRARAARQGDQRLYQGRLPSPRNPRAGIVPEDLVFQNPVFRPEMNGLKVPHDIYVHIAGIDIVRVDSDNFYVLEDNARTPSGVSYMLENREIMLRLFPELFSRYRIAPVENYPDELLQTLKSVAPPTASSDPTVVLLTPGVHNSAYYEHSFLADKLGVELVEGRDLITRDDIVYMRTTEGLKRVDVIYRRSTTISSIRSYSGPTAARRARPDVGLSGRQCHARQRSRHRHRRRQGGLQLHARDREILSRRRTAFEKRTDLALPRGRAPVLRARPYRGTGGQGGPWLWRLRHADRAEGGQGDNCGRFAPS